MANSLGNMQTMAANIQYYMDKHDMTRHELCKLINVPYTTLCTWITAKSYPRIDKIEKMAQVFGVSKSDLVEDHTPAFPADLHDVSSFTRIPIVASVKAGYDGLATEDFDGEYESLPTSELRHPAHEYRVLRVRGNSMYPQIVSGDKVLVHLQPSVDSGDIAVVLYESDEATIKRVRYVSGEDWLDLVPANPEYETKHIEGAELEKCHMWGKVVKLMRDF